MSDETVNRGRRTFLLGTTATLGAVGAVGAAVPFVKSWTPSAKAKAAGAPVEVDISKLEEGQKLVVEWRGRPVWVVRRSKESVDDLKKVEAQLRDPASEVEQQPEYAKNSHRSIRSDIVVLVGLCTHLGCSPTYRPDIAAEDLGDDWLGGFYCPCHGSKFDFAGRVYDGVPAPTNLVVPPHKYLSENVIIIGVDEEEVA